MRLRIVALLLVAALSTSTTLPGNGRYPGVPSTSVPSAPVAVMASTSSVAYWVEGTPTYQSYVNERGGTFQAVRSSIARGVPTSGQVRVGQVLWLRLRIRQEVPTGLLAFFFSVSVRLPAGAHLYPNSNMACTFYLLDGSPYSATQQNGLQPCATAYAYSAASPPSQFQVGKRSVFSFSEKAPWLLLPEPATFLEVLVPVIATAPTTGSAVLTVHSTNGERTNPLWPNCGFRPTSCPQYREVSRPFFPREATPSVPLSVTA